MLTGISRRTIAADIIPWHRLDELLKSALVARLLPLA